MKNRVTKQIPRQLLTAFLILGSATLAACGGGSDANETESASAATIKYGAIAYGTYGAGHTSFNVAKSINANSQAEANSNAVNGCKSAKCEVALEFNECGALVVGKKAGGVFVVGTSVGSTAESAQSAADASCRAKGGLGCTLGDLKPICNTI